MNITELKENIDFLYRIIEDKEAPVVITLSQSSVGCRAFCDISFIDRGIDWEHNQVRIEPKRELVDKYIERDVPRKIRVHEYDYGTGRKSIFRSCPVCETQVKKGSRYCSNCGQRVEE